MLNLRDRFKVAKAAIQEKRIQVQEDENKSTLTFPFGIHENCKVAKITDATEIENKAGSTTEWYYAVYFEGTDEKGQLFGARKQGFKPNVIHNKTNKVVILSDFYRKIEWFSVIIEAMSANTLSAEQLVKEIYNFEHLIPENPTTDSEKVLVQYISYWQTYCLGLQLFQEEQKFQLGKEVEGNFIQEIIDLGGGLELPALNEDLIGEKLEEVEKSSPETYIAMLELAEKEALQHLYKENEAYVKYSSDFILKRIIETATPFFGVNPVRLKVTRRGEYSDISDYIKPAFIESMTIDKTATKVAFTNKELELEAKYQELKAKTAAAREAEEKEVEKEEIPASTDDYDLPFGN